MKKLTTALALVLAVLFGISFASPASAAPPAGVELTYTVDNGVVTYTATNTGDTAATVFARYNTENGSTVQSGPFGGWSLAPGESVVVGSTEVVQGNGVVLKATVYQVQKNNSYKPADSVTVAGSK